MKYAGVSSDGCEDFHPVKGNKITNLGDLLGLESVSLVIKRSRLR